MGVSLNHLLFILAFVVTDILHESSGSEHEKHVSCDDHGVCF